MPSPLRRLLAAACLAAAFGAAQAQVMLVDSVNTEHGADGSAEYTGFAQLSAANVDLLGPGSFGGPCRAAVGSSACLGEVPPPIAAPVPEPSTYALMLAGLAGIGFKLRQRRRDD